MAKATFSGHESFQCKSLWLKKGYDYIMAEKSFHREDAVVELGVGKNMVGAIRFWLKAFDIVGENDSPTEIGQFILGDENGDPFLEDIATLWILHYLLVTKGMATLYGLLFTDFHRTQNEFSKGQLLTFVKRKLTDEDYKGVIFNENTVNKDIDTLLKSYVEPVLHTNYEDFSTLLLPLSLIRRSDKTTFAFNDLSHAPFPPLVFLFAIKLRTDNAKVVVFNDILEICRIFCLTTNDLYEIFDFLHQWDSNISFDNTAGEQLFTMNDGRSFMEILPLIYNK